MRIPIMAITTSNSTSVNPRKRALDRAMRTTGGDRYRAFSSDRPIPCRRSAWLEVIMNSPTGIFSQVDFHPSVFSDTTATRTAPRRGHREHGSQAEADRRWLRHSRATAEGPRAAGRVRGQASRAARRRGEKLPTDRQRPKRITRGRGRRCNERIAAGVGSGDRHQTAHSRRPADNKCRLDNVVSREIAAGINLGRAAAVNPADLLIRSGHEQSGGGRTIVLDIGPAGSRSAEGGYGAREFQDGRIGNGHRRACSDSRRAGTDVELQSPRRIDLQRTVGPERWGGVNFKRPGARLDQLTTGAGDAPDFRATTPANVVFPA